ncbi:MAG: DEAD/DEAH box helicase [Bacillota bacterium]
MTRQEERLIRSRLRRSWAPFFGRFGRFTPIQVLTIPKILDGYNVAVAAPTASGKTEAVVAPVAERYVSERRQGVAILYVVPTRALANDTHARVAGPLGEMGISVALKHGDRPMLPSQLPECLITTPESLDSLLCRRPRAFEQLQVVIVDEIHLLDSTYRGDQLRVLLRRLERLATSPPSVHLLSATLSQPADTASRYASTFELVRAGEPRKMVYHLLNSHQEVHSLARAQGWRKLLCFCNLRESVEQIASELARVWHPYPVVAHHGSLSRQLREEAETLMKEADVAVCVATSTLEVGIDIGDIDLVVLAEVPWSITALLQRIGRGNRRHGTVQVAALCASPDERSVLEAMFEAAATGELPVQAYEPDLSVVVQQALSCIYQHPAGLAQEELIDLVSPLCSGYEATLILSNLERRGWVEQARGLWCPSQKLMEAGEAGRIHSNIPDQSEYRVIDVDSGKEIGAVHGVFDEVFVLGRATWSVVSVSRGVIRVRRFGGKASPAVFRRHGPVGAFFPLLPSELKDRYATAGAHGLGR